MVCTRGKKITSTSNETIGENDAGENALTEMQTSEEYEEAYDEGNGEKVKEADNNDENEMPTELYGDNPEQSERTTSEGDEIDDQDAIWEDDDNSEDSEEHVVDEDEVSEEEEIEEQDEDEVSGDEGTGEENDEEVEVHEEEAVEEEHDQGNIQEGKEIIKVDDRDTEEHNTEKTNMSLKKTEKSSQGRIKRKRTQRQKKARSGDKPESSSKKKAKKKVKSMGMIFMCSSKTKDDCYKYKVLGLPESKKDLVVKIYPGMRLFLYDVDLKLLYGIYKAAGPGGYNIEPKAFKSQFPSQVRFTVLDECLPLAEEKFKKVIKDNYFTKTKFDSVLNLEQVKKLCKLFIASSKGHKSAKLSRSCRGGKPVRKGKASGQRNGDKRRLTLREELQYERPHKRPRELISLVAPLHQLLLAPLAPTSPSYASARTSNVDAYRQDPYLQSRSLYRDRRTPDSDHRDPYRDGLYPPTERRDYYREGQSAYLACPYPYRDDLDYVECTDPCRVESRRRGLSLELHDSYRHDRNPYLGSLDSNRDGLAHSPRPGSYRDGLYPEPYSSFYKREPLLDHREFYREDRELEFRDPYRREEPSHHHDLPPLSLETRQHHDVGSPVIYAAYPRRLSYAEPADYPSRAGLARQYRL